MSAYDDMLLAPRRATRRMCAEAFGVEEQRLVGASRVRDLVIARQVTYLVLKTRFPDLSFPEIGKLMGGRDHSTIIHGIEKIKQRMERDPALRQVVASLIKGGVPLQHDAHVRRRNLWASLDSEREQLAALAAEQSVLNEDDLAEDGGFAEDYEPPRVFCEQCDQRMTIEAALRCKARICGLRGGTASSSAAVGHRRHAA